MSFLGTSTVAMFLTDTCSSTEAVESDNLYMGQSSSKLAEGAVSSDDDEIVAHRYTCKEFARRVLRGSIAYACLTLR